MKSFHSGVIYPLNPKLGEGQTGNSLRAGYRSRDALQRDTVYSALYKGQGVSESGQLFCTSYGCGAIRGIKIAQFSDLGLKRTFR